MANNIIKVHLSSRTHVWANKVHGSLHYDEQSPEYGCDLKKPSIEDAEITYYTKMGKGYAVHFEEAGPYILIPQQDLKELSTRNLLDDFVEEETIEIDETKPTSYIEVSKNWQVITHEDESGKLIVCVKNREATGENGKVVVEEGYSRSDDGPGWVSAYCVGQL